MCRSLRCTYLGTYTPFSHLLCQATISHLLECPEESLCISRCLSACRSNGPQEIRISPGVSRWKKEKVEAWCQPVGIFVSRKDFTQC